MKKLLISALGLGAVVLAGGQANAAAIVLDNFNDGLVDSTLGGPAPKSFTDTVSAGGIIGGSRVVNHNLTISDSSARRSALFINADIDAFTLSNGTGVNSTAGASYGPGLNTPLDPDGVFRFQVPFFDAPADQPASITLTVNGVSATLPITPALNPSGGSATVVFDAGLFGDPAVLNSANFVVAGPTGFDVEIDQFDYEGVVPEPMTILGTGLALTVLPGLKKAHSKKKAK